MVKWNDSSMAVVASNCQGFIPAGKVERTSTEYGKWTKIQVECPPVIQKYNKYMRGVDLFDENVDRFEWVLAVRIGGFHFFHLELILAAKMYSI
jgi:hypothetical protein